MTSHSMLSPSKRFQFRACPGSIREQAKFPDTPSGAAAIDGTHSHTLLETCIKAGVIEPGFYTGSKMTDHEGDFVVDVDRVTRVKVAFEYIKSRIAEFQGACEVISETRVEPKFLIGRDDMGGTVDVKIHAGIHGVLELIDYKDGINDAWESALLQMQQYAVGELASFKLPINASYPFSTVRLTVVQPKLAYRGGQPIRSKDYTTHEILDMIGDLVREAAATDAPDAPLVPGESQCKYCKAKGSCSALAGNVMKEMGVMFQPVPTATVASIPELAHQAANKDPNTMSDQQIREIMEAAPLMRQLLDAVDVEALRRFKAGISIPGLKAVYGRGSRSWALPEEQIADKLLKMGVPKSAVWKTKLVSPAQAEELTWEKTKSGEKVKASLSERQLKTLEAEYVTKLAGKLTIVSESDSRPAVMMNAAPLFAAIESPADSLPDWLKPVNP